jgi:hypothetical protein
MGNYYFLAASLPPIALGEIPEISFEELCSRLEINLSKKDIDKVVVLRRLIDLFNLRAFLLKEPIDPRGNLVEKEIDEAILQREGYPEYVYDFLDRYETVGERVAHFSQLLFLYFTEEIGKQKGFLKRYLAFERQWRLVLLALRSKRSGRDVAKELQFEDLSDPIVAQILAQKDAEDYEPPVEYRHLKELILSCGSDPWLLHQVLGKYRFEKIEEMVSRPLFSMDWILAYMAQLLIVEHWNELSQKKGMTILQSFKEG